MKEVFKSQYMLPQPKIMLYGMFFEWNAGYSEEVLPFTNNIPQKMVGRIY